MQGGCQQRGCLCGCRSPRPERCNKVVASGERRGAGLSHSWKGRLGNWEVCCADAGGLWLEVADASWNTGNAWAYLSTKLPAGVSQVALLP